MDSEYNKYKLLKAMGGCDNKPKQDMGGFSNKY